MDQLIDRLITFSDNIVCAFMEYSGNAKSMQNEFFTHEKKLAAYAHRILSEIEGLKIISVTYDPIISFTIDSVHPHDVAQYLAVHNICVRAGYHCAQVGLDYLGIGPVTRISLAPYNTFEEIDKTVEVLKNIRKDMYV